MSNTSNPKQVILIMTDTQRWDMLGCYGNPDMHTPNLDALASSGIRYERAYTCQPVCGPARSAIFTGTYPHTNGSWGNSMALGDNVKAVGQLLSDRGTHTAYIGKWHLDGSDYFGLGRCPDGWDSEYWYDMRCYLDELESDEDRTRSRDMKSNTDGWATEEKTYAHRCSERAIKFLDNNSDEDFLLVVSYDEPHHPFLCPQRFRDLYKDYKWPKSENHYDDLTDKPEHHRVWAGKEFDREQIDKFERYPQDFLACNSFVDYEIGRLLDRVSEQCPDAMIIYTADHGDAMNSHRIGGKGPCVYDEVARIPFIVRLPGVQQAGSVSSEPISHIDITASIVDFFGFDIPKTLEGKSALNAYANHTASVNDYIFMEYARYEIDHDGFGGFQPLRATFDGRYKLVINLLCCDELYDLQTDPQEMCNLINSPDHADARNKLHDELLDWMNRTRDPFRGYYWHCRPWRTDAPKPTWDYTGMTRQRENEFYEPKQLDYATGLEITEATRPK